MIEDPKTYADVVNLWKNAEDLADAVGEAGVTVRQWRNRDGIPPSAWRRVIEAAAKIDHTLTMEQLAAMAERKRAAS